MEHQTNDYKIGICCFSTKHVLFVKSTDWWIGIGIVMCPSGRTCRTVLVVIVVSVLTMSAVDREIESRAGQPKDFKLAFAASPISTHF